MKSNPRTLRTAALVLPLTVGLIGLTVSADENQPPTPQSMECVQISGYAKLTEDLACKIASSHHRNEQYPEAIFIYDEYPEPCTDPDNPMVCCVKGMMWGTIGIYDFVAGAACGFTVNDFALLDQGEQAIADLASIGYQQITSRSLIRVFLNTTSMPEPPQEDVEVKADFGLFLGVSGIAREDAFVSQRMTLTGARKLPRGTKMELDMVGAPPVREISGTLCAPAINAVLDNIAAKAKDRDLNGDTDDGGDEEP